MKTAQARKNVFLAVGALSFIIFLLTGCLKDIENTPPSPKTYLSVMHMAPRAPSVEIYFNDTIASSAISAGAVSSAYTALVPKVLDIKFKKAGSDSLVAGIPSAFYDSLKYYTLLLYNVDSTHAGAIRIRDDYSVLTTDKAFYRFFHMSPDAGNVDLYFDNTLIAAGRNYADNTVSSYFNEFTALSPGTPTVYVKKAGSDSVLAQANVSFHAANAYTLYLKGLPGGTGNNALSVGVLQAAD